MLGCLTDERFTDALLPAPAVYGEYWWRDHYSNLDSLRSGGVLILWNYPSLWWGMTLGRDGRLQSHALSLVAEICCNIYITTVETHCEWCHRKCVVCTHSYSCAEVENTCREWNGAMGYDKHDQNLAIWSVFFYWSVLPVMIESRFQGFLDVM